MEILKVFTIIADFITYSVLNLEPNTHLAESIHFFIEDITKIFFLMIVFIYVIGVFRASLNVDKVREYLSGKRRFLGYLLAAIFGAITPFCSCSSIPLFLAFTSARIPLGITMSFLITSPIVNEIAVVLLGSILGFKFTVIYVAVGILSGVIGGAFFDFIKGEKHLTDLASQSSSKTSCTPDIDKENTPKTSCSCNCSNSNNTSWAARHKFAKGEVSDIVGRIWLWVIAGISIGALFHGFVPEDTVRSYFSESTWWSVPFASIIGIPLYSSASAIVPVAESMISKGIPIGTTLTFMMSVVGASFPEFVMLKQVMKTKLLLIFFAVLLTLFTLSGWIFNYLSPFLF